MIQVFIDPLRSFETGSLKIHVIERTASHTIVYDGTGKVRATALPEGAAAPQHPISLPAEAAHPLLAALSQYLGAVEHPEQLRRDFDHLRGRHDKLVDHLLSNADDNARGFRTLTEQWGRPRR